MAMGGGLFAASVGPGRAAPQADARGFIAEAFRMKDQAVAAGDQPYGAVVVKDGAIIGYGPSRVVTDRNPIAHAEQVAVWDAQKRLGAADLTGAVMYSTSRPCSACEAAAASARLDRMYYGATGFDAGRPR
jgi:tRNA(Arg) A34 adenosine deaminase TadA